MATSIQRKTSGHAAVLAVDSGAGVRPVHQWQSQLPELIWAYAGKVDAQVRHLLELRTHRITAWLITRGQVRLVSDTTTLVVKKGQWVFFCGRFQKHDFSTGAELISISLRLPIVGEGMWRHPAFVIKAAKHPVLEATAWDLVNLVQKYAPAAKAGLSHQVLTFANTARIEARSLDWVAVLMEVRQTVGLATGAGQASLPRQVHPKVSRALAKLTDTPFHEKYRENQLAQEVELSVGHLNQLFVGEIGMTPRRLRELSRRREADYRVRHSDVSLKQIALELGFGSASHFSNWFRQIFGKSPRTWRKEKEEERV